ncbi:MAG: hypothetical protein Q8L51_03340 [Candidatus Amesbacteria bacterium]|nr:hypothetical protein [Candidatus Amesbacteria bacterium]
MSEIIIPEPPESSPNALQALLIVIAEAGPGALAGFMIAGPGGAVMGAAVSVTTAEGIKRYFFPPRHDN